jgi:predicted nucleic acid-binding Zn ribbon protein
MSPTPKGARQLPCGRLSLTPVWQFAEHSRTRRRGTKGAAMRSWPERQRQRQDGKKQCSRCHRLLPLDEFVANPRAFLRRSSHCRKCHRESVRDWRARNRERVNADRRQAYREAHPLPERPCVVCGQLFRRRPDALVCGEDCRRTRRLEQRKRLGAAAINGVPRPITHALCESPRRRPADSAARLRRSAE